MLNMFQGTNYGTFSELEFKYSMFKYCKHILKNTELLTVHKLSLVKDIFIYTQCGVIEETINSNL